MQVYVQRVLVHIKYPLFTVLLSAPAPSILTQVFNFEFEKSPQHVDADFSLRLNVQPVEIVYDEVEYTVYRYCATCTVLQGAVLQSGNLLWLNKSKMAAFATASIWRITSYIPYSM